MVELLENTIRIISSLSSGSCGYLLEVNSSGFRVLKIWGAKAEEFDLVNDYLFNQHLISGIDCKNLQLSGLLQTKSIASFFIKELFKNRENNQAVYLLLFSGNPGQFSDECSKSIISIVPILSQQVRRWFRQIGEGSSGTNILIGDEQKLLFEGNGLLSNWKENFNSLIETSPDLVFLLDSGGKFLLVNKSGIDLLEYPVNSVKNKHFTDFIDPEYHPVISGILNDALVKREVVRFEVSLLTKYERTVPFEINCRVIEKDEKVIGLLGIGRNLIEQKRVEIELKKLKPRILETNRLLKIERRRAQQKKSLIDELNRLKQEFVSNISHEFRTPLASIIGFAETIDSDPDLPPEMKIEFNRVILNEGKRLAKLINNILNLSKFENAGIAIKKDTFDIIKLVSEVADANRDFAAQKNITLTFEAPDEEIIIEADKEHLYQAINALLNNAIKFTNDFGRVKMIVSSLFREVEFIISDTGIGIPEKDLPYIFQKFYRSSRLGTDIPGTGVGLVFVKQIVDLHKGLITVQSDIDNGTTFMVKLPKTSKIEKI